MDASTSRRAEATTAAGRTLLLPPLPAKGRVSWRVILRESFRAALASLITRRVWSAVTMCGIIIGVSGVLTIDALGRAQAAALAVQIARLGSNVITITPGAASAGLPAGSIGVGTLSLHDVEAIQQQVTGVAALSPEVANLEYVTRGRDSHETQIVGVYPVAQQIQSYTVQNGRPLTPWDETTAARVALLGRTVANQLFGGTTVVGETVRIRNVDFEIVGVLVKKGHNVRADLDDVILIPFSTAQQRLFGFGPISAILAQADRRDDLPAVAANVGSTLRRAHRLAPSGTLDFTVTNNQQILEVADQQQAFFARILGAAALIALLLGGFGVMNLTLMAVADRTSEIGLRLAVGAHPGEVQLQFLLESLTLTLVGGVGGVAIGLAVALTIPSVVQSLADYPELPSPPAIGMALLVAAAIGVIFGFYPARKASGLDPIEALRTA